MVIDAPDIIRRHRLAARLSQRELARRAQTSSATLNRYESGQVDPGTGTLNRILRACVPRRRRWSSAAALAQAVARSIGGGNDTEAWRLVVEFLDDDRSAGDAELRLVLMDPPASTEARANTLVAALAEHVCFARGLAPPPWALATAEVVPWWFVAGEPFRALALRESPISFARRGIFVTRGALERV